LGLLRVTKSIMAHTDVLPKTFSNNAILSFVRDVRLLYTPRAASPYSRKK